ncbi:MAG: shikimate kinase [Bacteroidetes bacterium]|nr:MAG: shikimate kinase [Bacteroidota bacterium]
MKIFLVGFMGCGKTTLGSLLAQRLGWSFIDLDREIEERTGKSIPEIFRQEGEAAFRRLEAEALRGLETLDRAVVSTGGGAPCFHHNMDWMNQQGRTVFLHLDPETLAARLAPQTAHRPLLQGLEGGELPAFIHRRLEERLPFYRKAHLQLDARKPPEILGEEILSWILSKENSPKKGHK